MPALPAQTLGTVQCYPGARKRTSLTHPHYPQLQHELERQVQARTGCRVRDLTIELYSERVILRPHRDNMSSDCARHGVRDALPHSARENAIVVEDNAN